MDINSMTPASGDMIAEDGSVANIVSILNTSGIAPVSDKVHNIEAFAPRSGRVLGEDGKVYNYVDLLTALILNGGGGLTLNAAQIAALNSGISASVLSGILNNLTGLDAGKQATLVSGTNIKTINNQSILGSGNFTVTGQLDYVSGRGYFTSNTQHVAVGFRPSLVLITTYKIACWVTSNIIGGFPITSATLEDSGEAEGGAFTANGFYITSGLNLSNAEGFSFIAIR